MEEVRAVDLSERNLVNYFTNALVREAGLDSVYLSNNPEELSLQREFLSRWHELLADTYRDHREKIVETLREDLSKLGEEAKKELVKRFVKMNFAGIKEKKVLFKHSREFKA